MRNTKSLIFKRNLFFVLSILSIYLPIIVFFFIGFNNSTTTEKLALSSTAIALRDLMVIQNMTINIVVVRMKKK